MMEAMRYVALLPLVLLAGCWEDEPDLACWYDGGVYYCEWDDYYHLSFAALGEEALRLEGELSEPTGALGQAEILARLDLVSGLLESYAAETAGETGATAPPGMTPP